MTALPDWMVLPPEGLTAADYQALPEEVCRRIEIVDGAIVVNAAPRRPHQTVVRRLANVLEAACDARFMVDFDVDLRLRDVPLLNRRPDVVVYDSSLPDDVLLRPQHCLLVVEVMSPGSMTTDQADKPAEYAAAGIEHYWRLESAGAGEGDDRTLTAFRYQLDPTTGVYASAGVSSGKLAVAEPLDVSVDMAELL